MVKNWDLEVNCLGWRAFTIDLGREDPFILWFPNCESEGAKGPSQRVAVAALPESPAQSSPLLTEQCQRRALELTTSLRLSPALTSCELERLRDFGILCSLLLVPEITVVQEKQTYSKRHNPDQLSGCGTRILTQACNEGSLGQPQRGPWRHPPLR